MAAKLAFLNLLATLLLAAALPAAAVSLTNGDFESGDLAGYFTEDDAFLPNPAITVAADSGSGNHFASLDTASHASFFNTLGQDLTLPPSPAVLSFDFGFSTVGDSSFADPNAFPDSFAVSLVTAADFLDILVVDEAGGVVPDPGGSLPVAYDPTVSIAGFAPLAGASALSGSITLLLPASLLGDDATLFFDLFDEEDGHRSVAAVDNVALQAASAPAVPEPATGLLLTVGLAAMAATARRTARGRR